MADCKKGTPPLVWMGVVVPRGKGEKVVKNVAAAGASFQMLALARGTADNRYGCCFGLGETDKEVLFGAMSKALSDKILAAMAEKWSRPGTGMAFTVPLTGISGAVAAAICAASQREQGGSSMEKSERHEGKGPGPQRAHRPHYELVLVIVNQGYGDDVMELAKTAGATGGTILHGRGVGLKQAEMFFGVSIQAEKEMLMMVMPQEKSIAVMQAISKSAGRHTEAHAIVFSMPVLGVAGLRPCEDLCIAPEENS